MYFTDDALLPENQEPLIITAAPYGPMWMPDDYPEDIPVTWDEQVQKAVDCYNAGASLLHIHVRDPKTWAFFTDSVNRRALLREGWKDVAKVFIMAVMIDCIYQFTVLRWFYPGEALLVGVILALLPYLMIRGLLNRIARRWHRGAATPN